MKKILLVALSAMAIVACKNEPAKDYMVFSGKIENIEKPEIQLTGFNFRKKIDVKEDGTFSDTLKIDNGYFNLFAGKKRLGMFLTKTDDLSVNFDVKDTTNTYTFKGVSKKNNDFLIKKVAESSKLLGATPDLYKLPENEFLEKMTLVKNKVKELIESADIDATFKESELKNLEYNHAVNVSRYPMYHGYFTQNREFKASDSFPDTTKDVDLNDEKSYKLSASYRQLVEGNYSKIADEKTKESKGDVTVFFNNLMDVVNEKATNQFIKDQLLFNTSQQSLGEVADIDAFYQKYMSNSTNKEKQAEITKIYNKLKSTAKGKPSPKFVNYENHKGGTTSLDDLKGKYVYVDVWATWCGPCKREIPFLKKVEKQYHGKDIEFVSISIDVKKDHEKWKKMVTDLELGGVQLFADNDWKSQFVEDYSIQGIPRFILIDPKGNIVTPNAPRPSSPKLVELFTELKI